MERFHGTFRPDFLDVAGPFTSLEEAQAALDEYVVEYNAEYNAERPHQALDAKLPVTPSQRFVPVPEEKRNLVDLWLPPTLASPPPAEVGASARAAQTTPRPAREVVPVATASSGGPVEFDQVVPPSGNMQVAGRQFWLGPARAGQVVRFWAGTDVLHLSVAGARVKSVRSYLSVADLAKLAAKGAVAAGPPPLPRSESGEALEVDRVVSAAGTIALGGKVLVAAEILAGPKVGIRIEPSMLLFFDLDTRELLRTRANAIHPRAGDAVAWAATCRTATPTGRRARTRAATGRPHRHGLGLPPTLRPRPRLRQMHPDDRGLRDHPRRRARRRRRPRHPTHHPAGA